MQNSIFVAKQLSCGGNHENHISQSEHNQSRHGGSCICGFTIFLCQVEAQTLSTQTAVSGSGRYDGLGGNYGNSGSYAGGNNYNNGYNSGSGYNNGYNSGSGYNNGYNSGSGYNNGTTAVVVTIMVTTAVAVTTMVTVMLTVAAEILL